MKIALQILVAIVLHPIAFVLVLVDLSKRPDLDDGQKGIWAVVALLWGFGPLLYLAVGAGKLW